MELRPVSEYCIEAILSTISNTVMDYVLEKGSYGVQGWTRLPTYEGHLEVIVLSWWQGNTYGRNNVSVTFSKNSGKGS